ncbi:MAG: hypothetical protein AB1758_26825, partial [Candidatus Eremiobacterota bacterium]
MLFTRTAAAAGQPSSVCSPLRVTVMPGGPVDELTSIRVRFSQPMTGLTTCPVVPVSVEPRVAGEWRWDDPYTAVLEPAEGFRPATRYRVRMAAGTASPNGHRLLQNHEVSIVLPGPRLERIHPEPGLALALRPVFRLTFHLTVDPAEVLRRMCLRAGGRELHLEALERVSEREVVFRPVEALPASAPVTLEVLPGVRSSAGPEPSRQRYRYAWRTRGPLRLRRVVWRRSSRREPVWIRFSNPLDPEAFNPAWVRVTPAHLEARVEGDSVALYGERVAGQTYQVEVDARLQDRFGQVLGRPVQTRVRTASLGKHLSLPGPQGLLLPPDGRIPLYSAGVRSVACRLFRVDREQQGKVLVRAWRSQVEHPETLGRTWLHLGLAEGGHFLLEVQAEFRRARLWIQNSGMTLHGACSGETVSVLVTDRVGDPLQGVRVECGRATGTTSADGHVLLSGFGNAARVLALRGDDSLVVPTRWIESEAPGPLWCVFDDRRLYRPGETARVKGWIRTGATLPEGAVHYRLEEPMGPVLERGAVELSSQGGFDLSLKLASPGSLWLQLDWEGHNYRHRFRVEEFRPPEFEVCLQAEPEQPFYLGVPPVVRVQAAYLSGGSLAGAQVACTHAAWLTPWVPQGWHDFRFSPTCRSRRESMTATARLDGAGEAVLELPDLEPPPGYAWQVETAVAVTDLSRQAARSKVHWTLAAPEPLVGVRWGGEGVEVVVVTPDGRPVAGLPVQVSRGDRTLQVESALKPLRLDLPGDGPVEASVGQHRASVTPTSRSPLPSDLTLRVTPLGEWEVVVEIHSRRPGRSGVLRLLDDRRTLQVVPFR